MRQRLLFAAVLALFINGILISALLAQDPTADQRLTRVEDTIQVIRDYNDDFLSLVTWSLTTVVMLVALLLGFNWFQNQRSLRRELESLRAELRAFLESRVAEAEAPLREKLDEAVTDLEKKLKGISAHAVAPTQQSVSSLKYRVQNLEVAQLEGEYAKWVEKDVLANAARTAIELVALASDIGSEYQITGALDRLSVIISQIEKESRSLPSDVVVELERTLTKLSSEYSASKAGILQKAQRIHGS